MTNINLDPVSYERVLFSLGFAWEKQDSDFVWSLLSAIGV